MSFNNDVKKSQNYNVLFGMNNQNQNSANSFVDNDNTKFQSFSDKNFYTSKVNNSSELNLNKLSQTNSQHNSFNLSQNLQQFRNQQGNNSQVNWTNLAYSSASLVDVFVTKIEKSKNAFGICQNTIQDINNTKASISSLKFNLENEIKLIKPFSFTKHEELVKELENKMQLKRENNQNLENDINKGNTEVKRKWESITSNWKFNEFQDNSFSNFEKGSINKELLALISMNTDNYFSQMSLNSPANRQYNELFTKTYKSKSKQSHSKSDYDEIFKQYGLNNLSQPISANTNKFSLDNMKSDLSTDANVKEKRKSTNFNSDNTETNKLLVNPYSQLFGKDLIKDDSHDNDLDSFSLFLENSLDLNKNYKTPSDSNNNYNDNNNSNKYNRNNDSINNNELRKQDMIYAKNLVLVHDFKEIINDYLISDDECVQLMTKHMKFEGDYESPAFEYFKAKYGSSKLTISFKFKEEKKSADFNFLDSPDSLITKAFELYPQINDLPNFYSSTGLKIDLTQRLKYIGCLELENHSILSIV